MNADLATASAWTQADRRTQQTNIALNEFDAAMHHAATAPPLAKHLEPTPTLAKRRIRARGRAMYVATARVAAQLARIEGDL